MFVWGGHSRDKSGQKGKWRKIKSARDAGKDPAVKTYKDVSPIARNMSVVWVTVEKNLFWLKRYIFEI